MDLEKKCRPVFFEFANLIQRFVRNVFLVLVQGRAANSRKMVFRVCKRRKTYYRCAVAMVRVSGNMRICSKLQASFATVTMGRI